MVQATTADAAQPSDHPGILEIIVTLQKASTPDRELDLAIALALWPDSDLAKITRYRRGCR